MGLAWTHSHAVEPARGSGDPAATEEVVPAVSGQRDAGSDAKERDAEADGVEVVWREVLKGHAATIEDAPSADLTGRQGCGPMLWRSI